MTDITVLSPVGVSRTPTKTVPALPADLKGLTVGFLDNTKANFSLLANEMGEILRTRFGVARVVHLQKANASTPASQEILTALAESCDVVLAGSGD